ncbi:hypothetical protein BDQ17DRAFT_1369191 [Cyathus striatus]|nr:hypothetical protein BDQ17DRAFT_1369191 [Cyathus striatus]
MADTFPIAQYLDKTYPDTPVGIPTGTETIVKEIIDTNFPKLHPLIMFTFYETTQITNPVSGEYFERTRSGFFGKPVKDIVPTGESKILLGEESDVWMEVAKFQGGKWAGLLDDLKAYQGVV